MPTSPTNTTIPPTSPVTLFRRELKAGEKPATKKRLMNAADVKAISHMTKTDKFVKTRYTFRFSNPNGKTTIKVKKGQSARWAIGKIDKFEPKSRTTVFLEKTTWTKPVVNFRTWIRDPKIIKWEVAKVEMLQCPNKECFWDYVHEIGST